MLKLNTMKKSKNKIFVIVFLVFMPYFLYSDTIRKFEIDIDGTIKSAVFSNGKKEVAREIFDENMNIIKKTGTIQDGIVKQYSESGALYAEYSYKNNMLYGVTRTYYEDGKLMTEDSYKNDKLNGSCKLYYPSGRLKAEENYKDNLRDDVCKEYYENGKVKEVKLYKDGKVQRYQLAKE